MPPTVQDVFSNIARVDHMGLFSGGKPKGESVVKFLDLQKRDVAVAVKVPTASVRYDHKMPKELRDRIVEWANLINLVAGHFKGDAEKTARWFTVKNPMLGNVPPRDMVRVGRYDKLMKFVWNSLADNRGR